MKAKTLRCLVSVLAALVMAVSLLAGCGTKTAEQVQEQEDAQTIQVYLWSTSLYETYAPYVQSQLPDVNIEFIVGNNDLDFYKFLQENTTALSDSAAAGFSKTTRPGFSPGKRSGFWSCPVRDRN